MTNRIRILLLVTTVSLFPVSAQAASGIDSVSASDASGTERLQNSSRASVQYSWVIRDGVDVASTPHTASSNGFWFSADGKALTRGVQLATDAPGAAVHIAPANGAASLNFDDIELIDATGGRHAGSAALRRFVDPQGLRSSGVPFSSGSIAFELDRSVGAGRLTLRSRRALAADHRYVVQVVDRNSKLALTLSASREVYFTGDTLQARGSLARGAVGTALAVTDGFLVSPLGQRHDVRFGVTDGHAELAFSLAGVRMDGPGLWELNLAGHDKDTGVMRNVKTAFAVVRQTARLADEQRIARNSDGDIVVTVPVRVSVEGRYEARALLQGSAGLTSSPLAMMASTAAWLEPGNATLKLRFDADKMAASGLRAPFRVAALRLLDQSRLAPQTTMSPPARALVID